MIRKGIIISQDPGFKDRLESTSKDPGNAL